MHSLGVGGCITAFVAIFMASIVACKMLISSIRCASTMAAAQRTPGAATISSYSLSRSSSLVIFFESVMPAISIGKRAAAAQTGPASGPLPASSTPITIRLLLSKLFWRDCSLARGRQTGFASSFSSFLTTFLLFFVSVEVAVAVASAFLTLVDLRFLRPSALEVSVSSDVISAALRLGLPLVFRTLDLDVEEEEEETFALSSEALPDALPLLVDRLTTDGLSLGDFRL
mmetsp:Transcript_16604/g.47652  ORF Transcript_16604/g.47652 Transcript_16604/m.47652 type:complete len:229 (-) Transcript_16604:310-996(-)